MKATNSHVSPPVTFEAIMRFEVAVLITLLMFAVGGGTDFGVFLALLGPLGYAFPSESELTLLESDCPPWVRLSIYLFAAARFVAVVVGACLCFHLTGPAPVVPITNAPGGGT